MSLDFKNTCGDDQDEGDEGEWWWGVVVCDTCVYGVVVPPWADS